MYLFFLVFLCLNYKKFKDNIIKIIILNLTIKSSILYYLIFHFYNIFNKLEIQILIIRRLLNLSLFSINISEICLPSSNTK